MSPSDLSHTSHLITVQGGVVRIECYQVGQLHCYSEVYQVYLIQGDLFVNGNRVVLREILFDRGVIYGIDGVLRPPGEGGDCDVTTSLSTWVSVDNIVYYQLSPTFQQTNCSGSCTFDCPAGYRPVTSASSTRQCEGGCSQLCTRSSFERRCCSGYYGDKCTGL